MRVFSVLPLIVIAAGLHGCRRADDATHALDGGISVSRITAFLQRGDCKGATDYLDRLSARSRTVEWYDYRSQVHLLCGEATLNSPEDMLAISTLDEGLRSFPESPRLLNAKGEIYDSLGDVNKANHFYAVAREAVMKNLKEGRASDDDRAVLAELQVQRQPVLQDRSHHMSIPTLELDSSKLWAVRATGMISSGKCVEAIALLNSTPPQIAIWYELASHANAVCFTKSRDVAYRTAAISDIERGIAAFPSSLRLRLARAITYDLVGDSEIAERYYSESERLAQRALTTDSERNNDEARRILEQIAQRKLFVKRPQKRP